MLFGKQITYSGQVKVFSSFVSVTVDTSTICTYESKIILTHTFRRPVCGHVFVQKGEGCLQLHYNISTDSQQLKSKQQATFKKLRTGRRINGQDSSVRETLLQFSLEKDGQRKPHESSAGRPCICDTIAFQSGGPTDPYNTLDWVSSAKPHVHTRLESILFGFIRQNTSVSIYINHKKHLDPVHSEKKFD